jgi:uncharacterized protein YutE (UPF0331/DUF86 family)
MIKTAVVIKLLESLNEHVALLKPLRSATVAELVADPLRWNGVLHLLQVSVEHVTDVSAHLLAGSDKAVPDDHRRTILALGTHGILPFEFAQRIAPMTSFRNIVVHRYLSVDPAIVQSMLQSRITDFETFSAYVYEHLRQQGLLTDESNE